MSERIISIQALRFLAASLVVFHHTRSSATTFDGDLNLLEFTKGSAGVDLFFVISGFFMVYIRQREPNIGAAEFIARRILRVWPLYVFVTIIGGAIVFYAPSYFKSYADLGFIIQSALFIPAARGDHTLYPVLGQGWTLNMEVVFYTVFGLCLLVKSRAAIHISIVLLFLVCLALKEHFLWAKFYCSSGAVILEFLIGVAIAEAYFRGDRIGTIPAVSLMLIGIFFLLRTNYPSVRLLDSGLPSALIVFGAVNFRPDVPVSWAKTIDYCGHLSYSMYLAHVIVMTVLYRTFWNVGFGAGDLPAPLYISTIFIVTLLVSSILYVYIERPIARHVSPRILRIISDQRAPQAA